MEQIKQTATEWLYEQLTSTWFDKTSGQHILEQANKMFEEQIKDAYNDGVNDECIGGSKTPEQYYNETYEGNK
jgi:hypothetical protein